MEKKTLKQRMREDLQLRDFSPHTQKEYLMRVTHFARYFNRLPDKLGKKEAREYFLHLVRDKRVSYGVLNMTYCALKFIYSVTLGRLWEVPRRHGRVSRSGRPCTCFVIPSPPISSNRGRISGPSSLFLATDHSRPQPSTST